jgi:signal transduction histidine kinase
MAANAMKPQTVGKKIIGIKDKKGNTFFAQMCKVAEKPGGGWVEYWWPKPNEKKDSRKISYALKVAGTPYVVGAGFFDDAVKLETLEALTAPKK